jgi:hypothetical protein
MGLIRQVYALTTLPLGKGPQVPIATGARWGPEPVGR